MPSHDKLSVVDVAWRVYKFLERIFAQLGFYELCSSRLIPDKFRLLYCAKFTETRFSASISEKYNLETATQCELKRTSRKMKSAYRQPLKQGYLLKQSEVLKQWHLRYFVLSKECLCYYRSEKESLEDAPKEVIFFNDMSLYIDELPDKKNKYCLKLVKRSLSSKIATRAYFLRCFSQDERNEWLSQILQAKAMALVVDPIAWIRNQEASTDDMDFELAISERNVRPTTAKELLQKCRHKLTLRRSARDSLIRLFPENLNNVELKSISFNRKHWRTSVMML